MRERGRHLLLRLLVGLRQDRGDVPGWVLVTVMTAGLVTAIWMVADEQLKAVLARAMSGLGTR
ncbi:MAG: hypothetical protein EB027_03595 [Actinobacteria bacterium]|nr:hypothetical protein [Actinomycetota bacterium]